MGKIWLFPMDLDCQSPYFLPTDPLISHRFRVQFFSNISLYVDNSFNQSRSLISPRTLAFCEAFNCVSRFAGAFVLWFSRKPNSNIRGNSEENHGSDPDICKVFVNQVESSKHKLRRHRFGSKSKYNSLSQLLGGKISSFSIKYIHRISQQLHSLSLSAATVPSLSNLIQNMLAIPVGNTDVPSHGSANQRPCQVERQGCANLPTCELNFARHEVEPRTGIEFPTILNINVEEDSHSCLSSEVLVGTGSKTMTIIRIKSLKVYAFGFYVHPSSLCDKLGPKYASIPIAELKKHHDLYEDLLREDINMTIRLVVNCNGMKINTVKDAFEKSLRARLVKANPCTDYECLRAFESCFTRNISLPSGTTIDFRRTEDGQLLTEIGGNLIGAVQSKDLCRAFFDMYIGDVPISEQTKEEIGRNIASIIGRC
ncbi:hypothetical protein Dimus_020939 [Dionaea muscipula]